MKSNAYSLNAHDFKRMGINILIFNVPLFALTFLTAYSQGTEPKQALITASISFLTALIDMTRKYVEGGDNR